MLFVNSVVKSWMDVVSGRSEKSFYCTYLDGFLFLFVHYSHTLIHVHAYLLVIGHHYIVNCKRGPLAKRMCSHIPSCIHCLPGVTIMHPSPNKNNQRKNAKIYHPPQSQQHGAVLPARRRIQVVGVPIACPWERKNTGRKGQV
jgi:hypothetical protein